MIGWQRTRLHEILKLEYGKALPQERRAIDGKIPVYGANGVKARTNEIYCTESSIIVGRKGSAGEINLVPGNFWPLDVTYWVKYDDNKCDLKFLYYLLSKQNLPSLAKGVKPGINRNDVYSIECFLPPLPEQKRIVAILDEAFAAIATATANTEKNLANARELFESQLNLFFNRISDENAEFKLSNVCDVRDGTHYSPKYLDSGIPFVTQKNICKDGLDFSNTKFISESDHAKFYVRSNVAERDILISMIGANRGMACLVDDSRTFSIKNVGLIKASSGINMRFLLLYLKSSKAAEYVQKESRGGAQSFIGLKKLRDFPIYLPPKDTQEMVVRSLLALCPLSSKLELLCRRKENLLFEFKQSLLQKAFTGELTENPKTMDRALAEAGV